MAAKQHYLKLLISLLCGVALAIYLSYRPADGVSGSTESYLGQFAWTTSLSPNPTRDSLQEHIRFARTVAGVDHQTGLAGLLDADQAARELTSYRLYSLLGALPQLMLGWTGLELSPPAGFAIVHGLLLTACLGYAVLAYGWSGFAAAAILIGASPILWFIDKVQPTFLLLSLILLGVMATLRNAQLSGLIAFAIAALLEPLLILPALACAGLWIWTHWRQPVASWRWLALSAGLLLSLTIPLYWLIRGAPPGPEFSIPGGQPGNPIGALWTLLSDAELGLLPQWPMGLLLLLAGVALAWRARDRRPAARLIPILAVLLAAASSLAAEPAWNGAGTIYLSPYATWLVPLCFPLLQRLLTLGREQLPSRSLPTLTGLVLLILGCLQAVIAFRPSLQETWLSQSPASRLLWQWFPAWRHPHLDTHLERLASTDQANIDAVDLLLGPDCRQIAFRPEALQQIRGQLGPECGRSLNQARAQQILRQLTESTAGSAVESPRYGKWYLASLPNDALDGMTSRIICTPDLNLSQGGTLAEERPEGFVAPQQHGRWSVGRHASISCELPSEGTRPTKVILNGYANLIHKRPVRAFVRMNQTQVASHRFKEWAKPHDFVFRIAPEATSIRFDIEVPSSWSRADLGLEGDPRQLGMFVRSIQFR